MQGADRPGGDDQRMVRPDDGSHVPAVHGIASEMGMTRPRHSSACSSLRLSPPSRRQPFLLLLSDNVASETRQDYRIVSSGRTSVWSFVPQLWRPHLRTLA